MRVHSGRLIDRFALGEHLVLRAQLGNGRVLDVTVQERYRSEAASLWGGSTVRFAYRGGRAFFVPAGRD